MQMRNASIEPVGVQLVRHCDLLRRACALAADVISGDPNRAGAAAQIERLRNQSIEAKHGIIESLLHRSFIEETTEEAGPLAAAFDILMGAIARCAGAADGSRAAAISTAGNLMLRCIALMHDCTRRRNFDVDHAGRSGTMSSVFRSIHLLETELDRILRPAAAAREPLASAMCSAVVHLREAVRLLERMCAATSHARQSPEEAEASEATLA